MVLSAFWFSVMAMLVKLAAARLPSQEIVLARAVVSLVLSYALVRRAGLSVWGRRRGLLVLRGLLGFGGLSCFYYAVATLPLAEATLLHYTNPIFTAGLAWLFLRERAGASVLLAILLSLAGVALIRPPGVASLAELFAAEGAAFAVLVGLLGAVFSAAAYVTVRKLSLTEHAHVIVFYFPLVAVPLSLPTSLPTAVWPTPSEWLVLLGVGVATQLGQVYLTRGLQHEAAARATTVGYLQILFAAAWGWLLFGDVPGLSTAAGGALIVAGTLLVSLRREVG